MSSNNELQIDQNSKNANKEEDDKKAEPINKEGAEADKRLSYIKDILKKDLAYDREMNKEEERIIADIYEEVANSPALAAMEDSDKEQVALEKIKEKLSTLPKPETENLTKTKQESDKKSESMPDYNLTKILKENGVTLQEKIDEVSSMVEKKLSAYKKENGYFPSPENVERNMISYIENNISSDNAT